jgi:hypothetical protein
MGEWITYDGFHVEMFCKKASRAEARKHSKQYRRIAKSIENAILQAANLKLREHIKAGTLDKGFRARMIP